MDLVGTEDVVLWRINFYDSCSPMTLEALMQFETHPQELRHFTAVILSLLNISEKDITSRKRRPNSSFHLDTCKTWRRIFSAILISKPLEALFPAVSLSLSHLTTCYISVPLHLTVSYISVFVHLTGSSISIFIYLSAHSSQVFHVILKLILLSKEKR